MPNSLQSSAIASPASRRATNCSLSSIAEHSFQGITPSPIRVKVSPMCPVQCVTYVSGRSKTYVSGRSKPMSQAAHCERNYRGLQQNAEGNGPSLLHKVFQFPGSSRSLAPTASAEVPRSGNGLGTRDTLLGSRSEYPSSVRLALISTVA